MIYIDDSEPEGVLEPAFPYRDVAIKRGVDANQLYDVLSEVGRGKFGTVYKCQEKSTGLKLAAKFVPIPKREDKRNVEREVEIMNSLQHHLIIQLYAAYEYQKMMCVVLELVEGGELFDRVVDDEFVLTERVCVVFIRQICEAMEFIHRNNILHLDLKPENVLCLTQEGNRIKIIDFGLARIYDPNKRLQILFGTPEFVAPEVVNFDCISYGTDMWSVGVICYVLISGLSPFMGETDIETMANVTIAKYDFEDEAFSNVSPECLDFIGKLLVKDLSTRMTAAQCLKHKWLQRRPKAPPIIATKPKNLPTPKLKAPTPSPIPPHSDNEDVEDDDDDDDDIDVDVGHVTAAQQSAGKVNGPKELDSTKDNLKNFIERWEEHPNSPYVFDVEGNVIAPLSESSTAAATTAKLSPRGHDSLSSSRVCSPSPCESIDTITDDDEVFTQDHKFKHIDDDSPSTVATPVNESREKLFPPYADGATSGPTTPTPPQHFPTKYAPAHLYGGNNRPDEFSGSTSNLLQQRSIKSYLHTFDRRNSDTNYLLGRRASGERINLADEIRKLSDHLLMLAEINNKFSTIDAKREQFGIRMKSTEISKNDANNNVKTKAQTSTTTTAKAKSTAAQTTKSSGGTSKVEASQTKQTNKAALNQKSSQETSTNSTSTSTASKTTTTTTTATAKTKTTSNGTKHKRSTLSIQRLQQSIEETPKLINGTSYLPWIKSIKKSTISTINTGNVGSTAAKQTEAKSSGAAAAATSDAGATAATRRSKFRVTQMSRDVPVGLPDMHQTVNLEEAANTTKDCLLHLLEKYNETKCRNPLARHQSISLDWNTRDNLEYRSMSSINAFFQRHNSFGNNVRQLQAQLTKTGNATTTARNNNNNSESEKKM